MHDADPDAPFVTEKFFCCSENIKIQIQFCLHFQICFDRGLKPENEPRMVFWIREKWMRIKIHICTHCFHGIMPAEGTSQN